MAIAKPRRTFKRTTRKRTTRRKPTSLVRRIAPAAIATVGGFALKVLKNKLGLNTETKFLDTIEASTTIGTTMAAMAYTLQVPQGNTCNDRSGSDFRLTSHETNLTIIPNVAAITPGTVRVVAMAQRDSNGNNFGSADIMSVASNIRSPYNMNSEGYNILYDRTFDLTWGSDQKCINVHISLPLGLSHHVKFLNSDTLGNAASVKDGYVRFFIQYEGLSAGQPSYAAHHRIKWVDN